MLVLTRKSQESVAVGGADMSRPMLSITVVEIAGGKVLTSMIFVGGTFNCW